MGVLVVFHDPHGFLNVAKVKITSLKITVTTYLCSSRDKAGAWPVTNKASSCCACKSHSGAAAGVLNPLFYHSNENPIFYMTEGGTGTHNSSQWVCHHLCKKTKRLKARRLSTVPFTCKVRWWRGLRGLCSRASCVEMGRRWHQTCNHSWQRMR